jgi:hypothetical protein
MIADTDDLVRVLATYYLSRQAFGNHLVPVERITVCEWSDGDDMVASWTRSWRPGPCPSSSITTNKAKTTTTMPDTFTHRGTSGGPLPGLG